MKNSGIGLLGALALGICCGTPLVLATVSLPSMSWLFTGPTIGLIVGSLALFVAAFWSRKRKKSSRRGD